MATCLLLQDVPIGSSCIKKFLIGDWIDWSIWLIDSIGWLIDWLLDWLIDWLVLWLIIKQLLLERSSNWPAMLLDDLPSCNSPLVVLSGSSTEQEVALNYIAIGLGVGLSTIIFGAMAFFITRAQWRLKAGQSAKTGGNDKPTTNGVIAEHVSQVRVYWASRPKRLCLYQMRNEKLPFSCRSGTNSAAICEYSVARQIALEVFLVANVTSDSPDFFAHVKVHINWLLYILVMWWPVRNMSLTPGMASCFL